MKKSLFILMMVLVTVVSCKKNDTTEEPKSDEPVKKENNINYMLGQYVGPLTEEAGAPEFMHFVFAEGEVGYIPQTGSLYGTGTIYRVILFTESVDANMFPKAGRYNGNESFEANTFYCTSSSSANAYTTIWTLDEGSISNDNRIMEGTIDIAGNSETGEFVLELKDENGVSHSLYYKGAAPVEAAE